MKKKLTIIGTLLLVGLFVLAGCGTDDEEIVVGGQNYTETYIMADMISFLIEENSDLDTTIEANLGGSTIHDAILNDEIDVYLEYTGTGLINIGEDPTGTPDEIYEEVKQEFDDQFNIKWLEPYGFNNTYAMVTTPEIAEEYELETVSDLAAVGDELRLGGTHTFLERADGLPGLTEHYDFNFGDVSGMEPALMYTALVEDEVDVISGFATEGRIPAFDLVILEDDQSFFPPYDGAPIIRGDVLEEHPELEEVLNQLSGRISDETMGELNASVDLDENDPDEVAREFLLEEGLIDE